ncbi:MAG: ectonucleotide pyrophosphatase/phosphodiesterase [Bacteroidales bacterium]|nr:ectonucleotide pyrophosphatase/phosphodiesterase [Bacteroidales bacterium]MDD3665232.1 ectonucleotide pyrophosphatase/phosphodiesterase [Bacteroidales bacterium]
MFKSRFLFIIALLAQLWVVAQQPAGGQYVVMLSLDAFRWDYQDIYNTPNLKAISSNGVHARSLISSFPTVTFPNHYSMATGLYPNNHGLVFNNFYDTAMKASYRVGDRKAVENGAFYGGEPIWVTAEKQGMISASYFWVGTEAPVQGVQPTYWKRYEHKFPFENRIDTVIHWLSMPLEKRPRLITFYMHEPDEVSHHFGPRSQPTRLMVERLDSLVGVLRHKLTALPIADSINLIVVSDHGMEDVSQERVVLVDDFVPREWIVRSHGSSPAIGLVVIDRYVDSVLLRLKHVDHIRAWRNTEVPQRLHFGSNPRIGNVVVLADSAWNVGLKGDKFKYVGAHGFDNANTNMHGIFYAEGPAFRKNFGYRSIPNVCLYPIIARILHLKPAATDGKLEEVKEMLRD